MIILLLRDFGSSSCSSRSSSSSSSSLGFCGSVQKISTIFNQLVTMTGECRIPEENLCIFCKPLSLQGHAMSTPPVSTFCREK